MYLAKYSILIIAYFCIPKAFGKTSKSAKLELRPDANTRKPVISYKLSGPLPWQNIPQTLLLRNFTAGAFCARGSFLIYDEPEYHSSVKAGLSGVTLYTSDAFNCLQTSELGALGSVQLVTSWRKRKSSTITFFPDVNFGGIAMVVNDLIKPTDKLPNAVTAVKSFLTVGRQKWTVLLTNGIRLCIKPPQDGICFISNLHDKKVTPSTGVTVVRKGCKISDPGIKVELSECYSLTQGKVNPIKESYPVAKPSEPSSNTTEGNGTQGATKECDELKNADVLDEEQKRLIEARLKGTLGTSDWMQAITNPKNIWKIELFDKSFRVLSTICSVIDTEYLLLFSALYFYHLDKAWESGQFSEPSISEYEWRLINHEMDICVDTVSGGGFHDVGKEVAQAFATYTDFNQITDPVDQTMEFRPDYDHVMEINWYMANLVGGVCNFANGYNINFLHQFFNLYHVLYFAPIEQQWQSPGKITLAYKYIFGGYGMQKSLAKIAHCSLNAIRLSELPHVFPRPLEQSNTHLLPYGIKAQGNMNASSTEPVASAATTAPIEEEGNQANQTEPAESEAETTPVPTET